MPMYSSRCNQCSKKHSYYASVANRADTPKCCDAQTEKTLDAVMVGAESTKCGHSGFVSWAGNGPQWIEDGSSLQRHMKEHNLVPEHEGIQEATYQKAENEKADDRKLQRAVETAVLGHAVTSE